MSRNEHTLQVILGHELSIIYQSLSKLLDRASERKFFRVYKTRGNQIRTFSVLENAFALLK